MAVKLTKYSKHLIRSVGLNENWLQEQIFANPEMLQLSDNLQPLKEKKSNRAEEGLICCSSTRIKMPCMRWK